MDLDFWDCFGRKKICLIKAEIWYVQEWNLIVSFSDQLYFHLTLRDTVLILLNPLGGIAFFQDDLSNLSEEGEKAKPAKTKV